MRTLLIPAVLAAFAGVAHAQDVQFTSPADGTGFALGTPVAPTGIASEGVIPGQLDVTFVIDTSGSMFARPIPGDARDLLEITTDAVGSLTSTLSDGTNVAGVEFATFASTFFADTPLSPAARLSFQTALDGLTDGGGTSFAAGLQGALDLGISSGEQVLFFSDGQSGGPYAAEAAAIEAAGGVLSTIALPGASTSVLADIAAEANGNFFDLTADPAGIVDVLLGVGGGGGVNGLTSLTATLPDSTTVDLVANLLGEFTLPSYALGAGSNVFTVEAIFQDGSVRTDTLTLNGGDDPSIPPVPLPASALLLIGALGGLAAARRRRG